MWWKTYFLSQPILFSLHCVLFLHQTIPANHTSNNTTEIPWALSLNLKTRKWVDHSPPLLIAPWLFYCLELKPFLCPRPLKYITYEKMHPWIKTRVVSVNNLIWWYNISYLVMCRVLFWIFHSLRTSKWEFPIGYCSNQHRSLWRVLHTASVRSSSTVLTPDCNALQNIINTLGSLSFAGGAKYKASFFLHKNDDQEELLLIQRWF